VGIRDWLKPPSERRRWARKIVPDLRAVYWDGATNIPHAVVDIGEGGAAIETSLNWHVGTFICLNLCKGERPDYASLWCEVVRKTPDGFGVRFLFTSRSAERGFKRYFSAFDREAAK
jgi:hypothetical protein